MSICRYRRSHQKNVLYDQFLASNKRTGFSVRRDLSKESIDSIEFWKPNENLLKLIPSPEFSCVEISRGKPFRLNNYKRLELIIWKSIKLLYNSLQFLNDICYSNRVLNPLKTNCMETSHKLNSLFLDIKTTERQENWNRFPET